MQQDDIQQIKNAYKGVSDNLVTLWNARLDLLADNRDALEELLEDVKDGAKKPKNVGCNTVAGCGQTNSVAGCGPLNSICGANSSCK
jgi:hypothetical protein